MSRSRRAPRRAAAAPRAADAGATPVPPPTPAAAATAAAPAGGAAACPWGDAFPFDPAADAAAWRRLAPLALLLVALTLLLGAAALAPASLFRRDHDRARALAAAGDVDAALALYERLERRRPDNPSLPFERGNLLLARARPARDRADLLAADEAFRGVLGLLGYHREAAAGRAEAALLLGQTQAALELLAVVRGRDPDWAPGRLLHARAMMAAGRPEAAAYLYAPLRDDPAHAAEVAAAQARILAALAPPPAAP